MVSDRALNLGFFIPFFGSDVSFYFMSDASAGFVTARAVLEAFVDAGLIDLL